MAKLVTAIAANKVTDYPGMYYTGTEAASIDSKMKALPMKASLTKEEFLKIFEYWGKSCYGPGVQIALDAKTAKAVIYMDSKDAKTKLLAEIEAKQKA